MVAIFARQRTEKLDSLKACGLILKKHKATTLEDIPTKWVKFPSQIPQGCRHILWQQFIYEIKNTYVQRIDWFSRSARENDTYRNLSCQLLRKIKNKGSALLSIPYLKYAWSIQPQRCHLANSREPGTLMESEKENNYMYKYNTRILRDISKYFDHKFLSINCRDIYICIWSEGPWFNFQMK